MKVTFAPNNYQPNGTISFASWANSDLLAAIRLAFHESPRERITEIVVEQEGIKAIFEHRPSQMRNDSG